MELRTATVLVLIVIAGIVGWLVAHDTVAKECSKLGSFYVGKTVFECKVKE